MKRRDWLLAHTALATSLALPGLAHAQARTVRLVVPYPAGGPSSSRTAPVPAATSVPTMWPRPRRTATPS
jgi:hypothetical protein